MDSAFQLRRPGCRQRGLSPRSTDQPISIDAGEVNIHPGRKKVVGERLARVALARVALARVALARNYGKAIIDSGPVFKEAVSEGSGYRVTFTKTGGPHRLANLSIALTIEGFELAGTDKVFKPAQATIGSDSDSVLVTSTAVPDPAFLSYGWRDLINASLFNREGLLAVPFRTDTGLW